ncbi:Golgin candidate 2 [Linum grandiflorum]
MSNWISSKLRVAETFFEQIDQQAAESLKKNEGTRSEDLKLEIRAKGGGSVPLKDQLRKKKSSPSSLSLSPEAGDYRDELIGQRSAEPVAGSSVGFRKSDGDKEKEVFISAKPKPTMTDSDWTALLGSPSPPSTSSHRSGGGGGVAGIRGPRKDFRRQVSSEGKRNVKASNVESGVRSNRRPDPAKIVAKRSDADEASSSARSSNVKLQGDVKGFDRQEVERKEVIKSGEIADVAVLNVSPVSEVKKGAGGVYDRLRSTVKGKRKAAVGSKSLVSDDVKRGSSYSSDGGSDSGSEFDSSSSDSEDERERERREKILAEKAIAKAAEAVKERENYVARLEGEKQSLEKILEERAKQAAEEASELQTTMMETMEAADVEHEKHKNTRMEALSRLAELEITAICRLRMLIFQDL